jgi:uncharacterized protein YjcR
MEYQFNIEKNKIDSNQVLEIIKDYKNSSNQDLQLAMDYIQKDFEFTKQNILKFSKHLDELEYTYNTILKEYQNRNAK